MKHQSLILCEACGEETAANVCACLFCGVHADSCAHALTGRCGSDYGNAAGYVDYGSPDYD